MYYLLRHFVFTSYPYTLRCNNKSAQANFVHNIGGCYGRRGRQLGRSSARVISVTVRARGVEGGTLVSVQRNTVLDAQWQVRLEIKGKSALDPAQTEMELTLEM
jgi:hypothetical protein